MQVVEVPDDALVIRFPPVTPELVLKRAGLSYRRQGHWTSSVFAALKMSGESDENLRGRLLAASELQGIDPGNNQKYYVCGRAGDLLQLGFVFTKDGGLAEATEHYSVLLGDSPTLEDMARFLSAFTTRERRPQ